MRTRTAAVLAALILGAALGGCGSDHSAPKPSPSPTTVIGPGADITNDVQARADVRTTRCSAEGGKRWRVVAKVTNSGKEAARYRLALRFASAKDGEVVGRKALTTGVVAAGSSTKVDSTARLTGHPKDVNCIFVAIERDAQ